jgi:hypothetical protein
MPAHRKKDFFDKQRIFSGKKATRGNLPKERRGCFKSLRHCGRSVAKICNPLKINAIFLGDSASSAE